jgi:hypothetical protein
MTRTTSKKTTNPRQPKTRRFKLTVEGQPMLVDYKPDWMDGLGMFEFRSPRADACLHVDKQIRRPGSIKLGNLVFERGGPERRIARPLEFPFLPEVVPVCRAPLSVYVANKRRRWQKGWGPIKMHSYCAANVQGACMEVDEA